MVLMAAMVLRDHMAAMAVHHKEVMVVDLPTALKVQVRVLTEEDLTVLKDPVRDMAVHREAMAIVDRMVLKEADHKVMAAADLTDHKAAMAPDRDRKVMDHRAATVADHTDLIMVVAMKAVMEARAEEAVTKVVAAVPVMVDLIT